MAKVSEHNHLVGPSVPDGEFSQGALVGAFDQLGLGDATRVHARSAHADRGFVTNKAAEHDLDVVEPIRHLLVTLGARGGITDQEYLHVLAFTRCQRSRQSCAVVDAFAAVGGIIQVNRSFIVDGSG
jgi:hypothetical protein